MEEIDLLLSGCHAGLENGAPLWAASPFLGFVQCYLSYTAHSALCVKVGYPLLLHRGASTHGLYLLVSGHV